MSARGRVGWGQLKQLKVTHVLNSAMMMMMMMIQVMYVFRECSKFTSVFTLCALPTTTTTTTTTIIICHCFPLEKSMSDSSVRYATTTTATTKQQQNNNYRSLSSIEIVNVVVS